MPKWIIALALVGACGKKESPPKTDFEAYEQKYVAENKAFAEALRSSGQEVADKDLPKTYRGVYVGASGVWIDRTLIATLAEIESKRAALVAAIEANAKLLPTIGFTGMVVTLDVFDQPAAQVAAAMQLFAGRETHVSVRREDPETPQVTDRICTTTIRDAAASNVELVNLSLLVQNEQSWVGLSRVNEFQQVPKRADAHDWEKLEAILAEHKASAYFADRTDMEIGFSAGKGTDVIAALHAACKVGFVDIAFVKPDQLSAIPKL